MVVEVTAVRRRASPIALTRHAWGRAAVISRRRRGAPLHQFEQIPKSE